MILLYVTGGYVIWYNLEINLEISLQIKHIYHMIQELHSWAFILEKLKVMFSKKPIHKRSWHPYFVIAPKWKQPKYSSTDKW